MYSHFQSTQILKKSRGIYFLLPLIIIFFCSITLGCEKFILEENRQKDNVEILDEYIKLIREKYAILEAKEIDLDGLRNTVYELISPLDNEEELFKKIALITLALRDGHSYLKSDKQFVSYNPKESYPLAFDTLRLKQYYWKYLNAFLDSDGQKLIRYGTLPGRDNIGYLYLQTFNASISDTQIDHIFAGMSDTDMLIIDIRDNLGGNPNLAYKFASYLTESVIYTGKERFKTGPHSDDFSDSEIFLYPTSSSHKYIKPVYILTDRGTFSAAITLVYLTDAIDRVKTVGQKSGGGSGSISDGFLSNGWQYQLSVSEFIDAKGNHLDDGVMPNIPQDLDESTTVDAIIERAISDFEGR